ncbi:hypothetical protein GCM10009827_014290 [Dactylosporangium maewongense]|uniref:FG-GAP repeat protein n=1 Tax=Dactylosporangium maewongense TaxID=634393 RepID=A0ABN1ZR47_9ACTN
MTKHPLLRAAVLGAGLVLAQALLTPAAGAATVPPAAPTVTAVSSSFTVGVKGKFSFAEPAGSPVPTAFVYQLNSGAPTRVAAGRRTVTVQVVPTRFTNTLAVTAVEPDGTFTDTTTITFNAVYPPPFADQDLTGDGQPDLLTAGPATGLPQGVWLAAGRAQRGGLRTPAAGIAGLSSWPAPDFDGAQVIAGRFTGTSFNDVLVFYPTGLNAGLAMIVPSLDNGGPLDVTGATVLPAGTMSDLDGNNPIAVANAYDSAGAGLAYPDLFGIVGAPGSGYTLDYYPNFNGTGAYYMPSPTPLATPAGGTDWESWRIASKLLPSGTALLLWNGSTGAVHLWTSVTYDGTTLHYTDHRLATDWHPGAASVQLTQDADGNPVIWTVSTAGVATAYLVKNLSALKAQPAQPLLP